MTKTMMKHSETVRFDDIKLKSLKVLVANGEGKHLEFKRKAAHPEKIVREMIAFANAEGGNLLIGVADDGTIPGVKFPDEEIFTVQRALKKHCWPFLKYRGETLQLSANRFVINFQVYESNRKPHYFKLGRKKRESFVRVGDKSIQASHEVLEIIRLKSKRKDAQFTYGEHEQQLFRYLDKHSNISLNQFIAMSGLTRLHASTKLIQLVVANVLMVTPHEKGDLYSIAFH